MKKILALAAIVVLPFLSAGAFAQSSKTEQAGLDILRRCQAFEIDYQKLNEDLSNGESMSKAKRDAAIGVTIDSKLLNEALSAGKSFDVAVDIATNFKYLDNSRFCRELRTLVLSRLENN